MLHPLKLFLNVRFHNYAFYISNTIFWICGWGALSTGIWLYTQKNLYSVLAPTSYSAMSAAGLCTAVGAMVLIIAFIGCVGNWLDSKCLLISSFCFVSLLFMIQCMTGVMGYLYRDIVRERAKISLRYTMNHTLGDSPKAVALWSTWNQMQTDLKCCGVDNYTDWFSYPRWKGRRFVPDSCCDQLKFNMAVPNVTLNCGKNEANHGYLYPNGCALPFTDWLLQHLHIVGMVALLFVVVEAFVLATSLRLICHLHKTEKKRRHPSLRYKYTKNGGGAEQDADTLMAIDNPDTQSI